jgi:hypothetical protein
MQPSEDRAPDDGANDNDDEVVPASSRHQFKLRLENQPDAIPRVLKPFADLGHGASSLLAIATKDGRLLVVAEFDDLSVTHAKILTHATRRLPGVIDCEATRLSAKPLELDG